MEKHILWKMINENADIDIKEQDLQYLSMEFIKQYHLLKQLKELGADISKEQLELSAIVESKKIDINYAQLNEQVTETNEQQVYDLFLKKKKQEVGIKNAKVLLDTYNTGDYQSLEKAKQYIDQVINTKGDSNIKTFKEAKQDQLDFLDKVFKGEELDDAIYLYSHKRNLSKQFMKLSYALKYIAAEDLTIIGGRPSVGKTSFVLSLMNVLGKNGYRSLFFTLEMTSAQVIHRMATAKSGITNNEIFDVKAIGSERQEIYKQGLEEISNLPILTVEDGISSWLDMKRLIIENRDKIDYVVVDHLTYIPSYDGTQIEGGHNLYSKIIRDMKQTSKEYKIPIILLAQLNRGVSNGQKGKKLDDRYYEIFMRDFRESGSIEEYADKILLLYRLEDKNKRFEQFNTYKIACKIEKNRAGKTGIVEYWFYADKNRWREVDLERKLENGEDGESGEKGE